MKRLTIVALLLATVVAGCGGGSELTIEDPWSRPVPPVAPASAVYLTIENGLESDVTLLGASSESCAAMELHETSMSSDGVMSMAPLTAGLMVPAGESARLEPGGAHLMCIDPDTSESFSVTLDLDGAAAITVDVVIEDR